ncbi:hypothetical protein L917_03644 [Phytophthora nicotianae]|uniref:Uncharacterized protein n=1 Tax=Phytophthora nicotianae TaxID=4792 RepID=W2LQ08_PHYNI|nr:hypothetical protein L917_03644 [Phytophthora nicotianae]
MHSALPPLRHSGTQTTKGRLNSLDKGAMSSFRLGASGYTVFKRPLRFVNRQSARPVSFVGLQLTHTSAESVQPSLRLEDDTQVSSSQPVGHEPPHRSTQVLVGPVSGLTADTLVCQVQSSS